MSTNKFGFGPCWKLFIKIVGTDLRNYVFCVVGMTFTYNYEFSNNLKNPEI